MRQICFQAGLLFGVCAVGPAVAQAPSSAQFLALPAQGQAEQLNAGRGQSGSANPTPSPGEVSQARIRAAFPTSNFGAASYNVPAGGHNGSAALPPLTPPAGAQQAGPEATALSDEDVVKLRNQVDGTRRASAHRPVRTVPRISTDSVDLSPGSALPILRTMPGETSTLVFLDATGAPWPLAAVPRVSDRRLYEAEWLQDTPAVVVSALTSYGDANITVFLKNLATPVVVRLASGEPDGKSKLRVVDYRLDLRVPGRGPNAQAAVLGQDKIALYDDTLQAFLDGLPPRDARLLQLLGGKDTRTRAWQFGDSVFVRTALDIQSAFEQSMTAADGTKVYRMPLTPYVTLSEGGQSVTLQLDIN